MGKTFEPAPEKRKYPPKEKPQAKDEIVILKRGNLDPQLPKKRR